MKRIIYNFPLVGFPHLQTSIITPKSAYIGTLIFTVQKCPDHRCISASMAVMAASAVRGERIGGYGVYLVYCRWFWWLLWCKWCIGVGRCGLALWPRSLCFVGATIIIIAFPLLAFRFFFEACRVRNDFSRLRWRAG